jgi:integrase
MKSSMARVRLDFVHTFRDRHGKRRHYFRRRGFKSATLPGLPGSAEFMEAYQAALAGDTVPRIEVGASRAKPGSVAAAVAAYLDSIDFGGLALATQRDRRAILDRFRELYGEKSFAGLERKHVDFWITGKAATPHAAKSFLKALRAVVKVAMRIALRADDPTAGIRIKTRDRGGWRTWTEDEITQFEAAYPIGTRERLAFALLVYTGQRRGDVIRMGRQHVKGGFLTVRQGKRPDALRIRSRRLVDMSR